MAPRELPADRRDLLAGTAPASPSARSISSIPGPSASRPARRTGWIRSSGCSWRSPGRRSRTRGGRGPARRARKTGVFVGRERGTSSRLDGPRGAASTCARLAGTPGGAAREPALAYCLDLRGPASVLVDTAVLVVAGGACTWPARRSRAASASSRSWAGRTVLLDAGVRTSTSSRTRALSPRKGGCRPLRRTAPTASCGGEGVAVLAREAARAGARRRGSRSAR